MGNLVNLEGVAKAYGTTVVLDGVSLGVGDGERIGVVGRNGGGKSTLLRLIAGEEAPDSGQVTRTRGVVVARVDQRGGLPAGRSVRETVVGHAAEHEWAGDAAVRAILTGLGLTGFGLDAVGMDADVARLSGGERRRVTLARALVQQADLLVLDEPTNHLDVEGITWLAEHLRARNTARGALVVVTHDRWFLDAVCEQTWEVLGPTVAQYRGGYAAYVLTRAERTRQADAAESRRQNLLRKELAWLRRGPPARTSKPRFRIDAAEALIADVPAARSSVELRALAQRRLGRSVVDLEDVTLHAGGAGRSHSGDGRVLLDHVSWHVGPGDRIGVIGVNGAGKTHLLRLLAGEIGPDEGTATLGATVHVGHLTQEIGELPDGLRVREAVSEVRARAELDGVELSAGQLAERFGFADERQWTPVRDLSGGERRRLQLLRLLLAQPNLLLLDEPTNDLDIDTLAALEDLLDGWAATIVIVSHDRYLLERVCDTTVALLGDGSLAALPGGVDEYLARRAATRAEAADERRDDRQDKRGDTRAARKQLARLERRVDTLAQRETQLHDELAAHATDYTRVAELDAELRAVRIERAQAEHDWLILADQG